VVAAEGAAVSGGRGHAERFRWPRMAVRS
jgi:hypothetical protein